MTDPHAERSASTPRPMVSIVVETITAREHDDHDPFPDRLRETLLAANAQDYARDRYEIIVVLDEAIRSEAEAIQARYPFVRLAWADAANYFAHKNAGIEAGTGELAACLDADCVPQPDWLASLVDACGPGVDAVAGRTRYTGASMAARTFSVPDFANVLGNEDGTATGFNVNNVLFRRALLLAHPLDARIRRNGGCYFLYHRLLKLGVRIMYAPAAVVSHGVDVEGFGFVLKHFDRGYDGTNIYRLDTGHVLRGSAIYQRFGIPGLVALVGRRILIDWQRLLSYRRQIGLPVLALPWYFGVSVLVRTIELVGGTVAALSPTPDLRMQPTAR